MSAQQDRQPDGETPSSSPPTSQEKIRALRMQAGEIAARFIENCFSADRHMLHIRADLLEDARQELVAHALLIWQTAKSPYTKDLVDSLEDLQHRLTDAIDEITRIETAASRGSGLSRIEKFHDYLHLAHLKARSIALATRPAPTALRASDATKKFNQLQSALSKLSEHYMANGQPPDLKIKAQVAQLSTHQRILREANERLWELEQHKVHIRLAEQERRLNQVDRIAAHVLRAEQYFGCMRYYAADGRTIKEARNAIGKLTPELRSAEILLQPSR